MCATEVKYYGQPVAIVVAESEAEAMAARDEVKVQYSNIKTPILSIEQAIKAQSFHPDPEGNVLSKGDAKEALKSCDLVVSGTIETGEQYPMYTETQTCLTDPQEGFYIIQASTQLLSKAQSSVASLLAIAKNEIEVKVRRVGGGFGAKQTRSLFSANATALAAYHTQRPVRMHLTLQDNMEIPGRRQPMRYEYQVGVTRKDMKIQAVVATSYENAGFYTTETMNTVVLLFVDNAYFVPNWNVTVRECKTNQPNHCYIRAPGILSMMHFTEQILNEVSLKLGVTPEKVKEANLYHEGQTTPFNVPVKPCYTVELWNQVKQSAEFDKRAEEIAKFNLANRWRKKAISLAPLKFKIAFPTVQYLIHVGINYGDGSVTLVHAGIELGQGINTKAIQVAAHTLGVSVDDIKVHPPSTSFNLNSFDTAGSITSDINCLGVRNACDILVARMAPYKTAGMSWTQLVAKCEDNEVDLHAKFQVTDKMAAPHSKYPMHSYDVFGAACSEVELDALTGNCIINRMDVLYDCGRSYSPEIDVGQVEGAVVMALGLFFHEENRYSPTTGQLLTNSTWNYHVPTNRDIPVDLRVSLVRNKPNDAFPLRSKVVAEPPMLLVASAMTSLRKCILEIRKEQRLSDSFAADAPLTVEKIGVACGLNSANFTVK